MPGKVLSLKVWLPPEQIRDCRITTLERIVIDSYRRQIRSQLRNAKAELVQYEQ